MNPKFPECLFLWKLILFIDEYAFVLTKLILFFSTSPALKFWLWCFQYYDLPNSFLSVNFTIKKQIQSFL